MAYNRHWLLVFGLIVNILLPSIGYVIAGREVPASNEMDKNQPEFLFFGCCIPKKWFHCGTCGGSGHVIPADGRTGSRGKKRRGSVPGGGNAFAPSPNAEAPTPSCH